MWKKLLQLIVNKLGQDSSLWEQGIGPSIGSLEKFVMLIANVRNKLHQDASKRADGRGCWHQILDVPPIHLDAHIFVASTVTRICKAVSAANPGSPRTEPISSARLAENITDVVDQLYMIGKRQVSVHP